MKVPGMTARLWASIICGPATTGVNVLANARDPVDFAVGFGTDRSYDNDSTGLSCLITQQQVGERRPIMRDGAVCKVARP